MRIDNPEIQMSGSLDMGFRRNITKISYQGYQGGLVVADGKVFTFNGHEGNTNWTRGVYTSTGNDGGGLLNMRELVFPGESGSLVDAGMPSVQGYALFDNGNLWMWGWNGQGQLGINDTNTRWFPALSTTNVVKFYSHPSQTSRDDDNVHYFILKTDGKVYGTGYNGFGQLGIGNTTNQTSWVEITGAGTNPRNVWPLGAYTGCTFIERADGSIWAAGYNGYGQLGLGNQTDRNSFVNTGTAWNGGDTSMRIQEIGFGGGYIDNNTIENISIAMFLDNGTTSRIATCGNNTWGQLGDTTSTLRSTPIIPSGVNFRVSKMAWIGGSPGSCWLLRPDGTLWNLGGYNGQGQLDRGTTTNSSVPSQVETGVLDILLHNHSWAGWNYQTASPIVRKADGYYRCGYNGHGQLGIGNTQNQATLQKMLFPQGLVFKMFGAHGATGNERHSFLGVDTEDRIWAWGDNAQWGIVAFSGTSVMAQPVQITPPSMIR
jgi:alpha-tubulin suppressor-like RCC1 family protein